jgi:hypothetical protein
MVKPKSSSGVRNGERLNRMPLGAKLAVATPHLSVPPTITLSVSS